MLSLLPGQGVGKTGGTPAYNAPERFKGKLVKASGELPACFLHFSCL